MRPILVNGIEEVASRSDLLDRTLSLNLPAITEKARRDERTVWNEFEKCRASILGGLCTAVSGALKNVENVNFSPLPRMADFAIWATAAEAGLGLTSGTFMKAYNRNRDQMNDLAIESSPIAAAIIALINKTGSWKGTATRLLTKLESEVDEQARRQQNWPKSAKALGGAIRNGYLLGLQYANPLSLGKALAQFGGIIYFLGAESDCAIIWLDDQSARKLPSNYSERLKFLGQFEQAEKVVGKCEKCKEKVSQLFNSGRKNVLLTCLKCSPYKAGTRKAERAKFEAARVLAQRDAKFKQMKAARLELKMAA